MATRNSKVGPVLKVQVKPQVQDVTAYKALQRIFVLGHFLFGMNNGFVETKNQKMLKILTIVQSTALSTFVFYSIMFANEGKITLLNLEVIIYMIFVVITMTNRYTYQEFQSDLSKFDESIKADTKPNKFSLKFTIFLGLVGAFTLFSGFISYKNDPIILNAQTLPALLLIIISNDFVRITFVFVFSCAHWRVKQFIGFVKKDNTNIVECQHLYRRIVDSVEKAKDNFNFVFLVTLTYNTVTSTAILFFPFLDNTAKTTPLHEYIYNGIDVAKSLFVVFAPTFTAGHLSAEVENLVLTLRDKVIQTKDETQRRDIKRFISYVEARPMKFTIYSVISLDWNLPITIVNISITYLIVMIQFTHNY